MALNADATFEFCPRECDKGLLPTILLCMKDLLYSLLVFILNTASGDIISFAVTLTGDK